MAVPTAPEDGNGARLWFLVQEVAGVLAKRLIKGYHAETVDSEDIADIGVYPTSGTLEHGGLTLSATTATPFHGGLPCQGVVIYADPLNSDYVVIGKSGVTRDANATTGGFPLQPGASQGVPCRNANEVYIRGAIGDTIYWMASAD